MPRVSVIIPTYNKAAYLSRAIDSVLSQTYRDTEIIVVDDGSTDHTDDVLMSYGDKIRCIHQANQERAVARNQGIKSSNGEYIAFLDDDDWWHPEKLSKQLTFFDEYPLSGLVCCFAQRITPDGNPKGYLGQNIPILSKPHDALPWFFLGHSIPTLTAVISRRVLENVTDFDTQITYIEDWDFWMRVVIDSTMVCIPEPLAYYQLHQRYMPEVFGRHRIQDGRIYVLDKNCKLLQDRIDRDRLSPEIIARGYARAWWYGGLIDYALGTIDKAIERSEKSYEADPSFFYQTIVENAREMMVGFSISLDETGTKFADAEVFLRQTNTNLPVIIKRLFTESRLISELSTWYGHAAYQNREYREAARYMKMAISNNPYALTNRGVVSVLVRSLIQ